jgi:hypothetical protein
MANGTYTEQELQEMMAKAEEAGAKASATEPRAMAARYDYESERIVVILNNGWEFGFKPWLVQGLEDATPEQLSEVEILGPGTALHWESLDADMGIVELVSGRYGSKAHLARVAARFTGKMGGSKTSKAKRAAVRENGKKGGRPRKVKPTEFDSASPEQ